jgi:hypothetical protein
MRLSRLVLLSFLLVACDTPRAADSSEDRRAGQGTCRLDSSTYDGAPQMADMLWVVDGDQYRTRYNQHFDEVPVRFKLDPAGSIWMRPTRRRPGGLTEGS